MTDYDPNADARRVLQVNAAGTVVAPAAAVTGTAADAQADAAANVHQSRGFGFNGATWDRIRTAVSDALASTGLTASGGYGFNGTTWDRLRTKGTGYQAVALVRSSDGREITDQESTDAQGGGNTGIVVVARSFLYNGATLDRARNIVEATLLASAARTTTQVSADIPTYNARNLQVVLDMTVVGTGSVTVLIEGKDSASGKYFTLLSGVAVVTNVTNRYRVSPDLTAAANSIAQDNLPRFVRITVTANNANSATYSVGYVLGV